MVSKTSNLNLTLPGNNELQDTWDVEINNNFQIIDEHVGDIETELTEAAMGSASLKEFLKKSHNEDGSLIATEEVVESRNSFAYGDEDSEEADVLLPARLLNLDMEIYKARECMSDIRAANAFRQNYNTVLSGSKDANGYPKWAGFTGKNVNIDGTSENIYMLIGGKIGRVRNQKQVTIDNVPYGTKYIYAALEDSGLSVVSGTTGIAGEDGSGGKIRIFQDTNADFSSVKQGDILTIGGTTAITRQYIVEEVVSNNSLRILGIFKTALASLTYDIRDPLGVTFGFDNSKDSSKFYCVEADWDGSAITAVRPIHFEDVFVGEWRSVDVGSGAGTFNETWYHNLFSDSLDISFQVSQANDGSAPIEVLSNAGVDSDLNVVTESTIEGEGVTGSVGSTLTGGVYPSKSVAYQFTKNKIDVANVKPGVFYTNYSGAKITTGYIRVVIKCLSKR